MKFPKRNKLIFALIIYILCILLSIIFLLPVIWTFLTSLKTPKDAFVLPPKWIFSPLWKNYLKAWLSRDFANSFLNTIIVGLGSVFLTIILALPMAYSLARYKFKGASLLNIGFLMTRMLPEMLFIIPLFVIYRRLNLYDTHFGLILGFQIFNLPLGVWLLRGFILQVPIEIEESALVDGCNELGALRRITIPLLVPGIAAVSILSFIAVWVNLLFPLCLTYTQAKTVSIAIADFKGYGAFNWPLMAAGCIIATFPQMFFFVLIQKYIVGGLTLGAVKG